MALAIMGGFGGRIAPARNVVRSAVARRASADTWCRFRTIDRRILGLDDAAVAVGGVEMPALDRAGQRAFPV